MLISILIFLFTLPVLAAHDPVKPISLKPISQEWRNLGRYLLKKAREFEKNEESLSYCPCISLEQRVKFAIELAREINIQKSRNETLEIASFASGTFFQEYLILLALIHIGYQKVNLNLIDPAYSNESFDRYFTLMNKFSDYIKKEVKESNFPTKGEIAYNFSLFENWQQYLEKKTKDPNIILFVDPDMEFDPMHEQLKETFFISLDQENILFLIRKTKPLEAYIKTTRLGDLLPVAKELARSINPQNKAISIVTQANAMGFDVDLKKHPVLSFDDFMHNLKTTNKQILMGLLYQPYQFDEIAEQDQSPEYTDESEAILLTLNDYLSYDFGQKIIDRMLRTYTKVT